MSHEAHTSAGKAIDERTSCNDKRNNEITKITMMVVRGEVLTSEAKVIQ